MKKRYPKTWATPSGQIYDIFAETLEQHHVMIAGASGSGKSVLENGLVATLLHRFPCDVPGGAELILIDPKGKELDIYSDLPHTLRHAVSCEEIIDALNYAMSIVENRFSAMPKGQKKYNGSDMYIFIDEFADLMTTQPRAVKPVLQRICQLGRAARVHVILCTQSPLREILPSTIKVNFDAIWGLRCNSAQDSRNIIGQSFLRNLPRYGQGYFTCPESDSLYVVPYIKDEEIQSLCAFWLDQMKPKRLFRRRAA